MIDRRRLITAALMTAPLGLAGCGLSERPYVERRQWPLIIARPATLPPRRAGRVLLIRTVRAGPGLDSRGLQTMQADGSVRISFYEEWAVPPAQSVENNLRLWLAGSGLFTAVIAPGSQLAADFVLEGDLIAFWADMPTKTARVALSVVVLDSRAGRTPLQRLFTSETPLAAADPAAIVAGLRAGLTDVLGQVEAALAGAVATV